MSAAIAAAFALLVGGAHPALTWERPAPPTPSVTAAPAPSTSGRNHGTGIVLAAAAPLSAEDQEDVARAEYEKAMSKVESDARKRARKPNDLKKYYGSQPKGFMPDDPTKPGVEDPRTVREQ